jgi:hypothetical protein
MTDSPVRRRAFGAILRNAIFSWQSFITIAITAVLFVAFPTPFPFWQPWFWLIAGVIAEAALVISAMSDPEAAQKAVAREFQGKYDLARIKSPVSRQRLDDAIEYRKNMTTLAGRHGGAMRANLLTTIGDVDDWIAQMYDLALHIDAFESNELVERDRRAVPQQIEKVKIRLKNETDPAVQRDLDEQLRQLELQRSNLEATASSVKRAEIQLDSALSALGTIYAQMSLLGTKEVDSSRAQRLRLDIKEEVASLQDTIQALDEVQAQRLQLR